MIPIICIVGRKNSGKTLLIERLIPQLQALGYRVGTLKHHHHQTNLDVEGKDSWRHSQAGADAVAILSPVQFVLFRKVNEDMTPESLIPFLGEVDCVLLEGFKVSPYPKIEIYRSAFAAEPLCAQKDHLIALVSDQPLERGVPCFTWQEIPTLAHFIQSRFLAPGPHGEEPRCRLDTLLA
jgi:molybdopterin-guanine dinucleotide biosynthesis protein B